MGGWMVDRQGENEPEKGRAGWQLNWHENDVNFTLSSRS